MNFFEQELRRLANACEGVINPVFAGRACYGDLGGDNRVKLQFVTMGHADHYMALKAAILNRVGGEVDTLVFRFKDVWGNKQVSNPNFREGVAPHIWTSGNKSEWYVYKPSGANIKQLAAEVGAYLAVFTDRSITPEKARGQDGGKESVVRKIRGAKQSPAPHKEASARKKTEPEL